VKDGGHGLLGVNAGWTPARLGGRAELRVTLTNLLDTSYHSYYATNQQVVGAYPGRPREALVGLRYRF